MIDLNDDAFKATLKETSKDASDKENIKYMTDSDLAVINFDEVKTKYANLLGLSNEVAYSIDALLKKNDNIFFIEFKNGKIDKATKRNIANKIRDSLLIYNDIQKISISNTRESGIFILVYNEDKNSKGHYNSIANAVMKLAKEEEIKFDLERFKKLYFKEVHTYTEIQFANFLENTLKK